MKYLFYSIIIFCLSGCSMSKVEYWCGDRPCVNKKEKEDYFKKTMTVEARVINKKKRKINNPTEIIIEENSNTGKKSFKKNTLREEKNIDEKNELKKQAKLNEEKRIKEENELKKQTKLSEEKRIKEENELKKQAKLNEKKRIKEENELKEQLKLDEKKRIKEENELKKKNKLDEKNLKKNTLANKEKINMSKTVSSEYIEDKNSTFKFLLEKIAKNNSIKSYPDLNDIPK